MLPIFLVFFALFCSKVTSWTVDLDEVKKHLKENEVRSVENGDDVKNDENSILDENYASDIEYQSYKEKEVSSIIRNGSVYLEGLSKALMSYRYMVYNCSKMNTTLVDSKERNELLSVCRTAANNSEYIQKLSELALMTTNQLRDKADDKKVDERNENELLLQLAWLLDRLAYLTGYEPNPKDYINTEELPTSEIEEKRNNTTEKTDTDSSEILEQMENGRPMSKLPPKETVKTIRKRSAEPLENVVKYYVKYKVWNSTNSDNLNNDIKDFDVKNELTVKLINKRSIKKLIRRSKIKN
ncbi:unnamed protein product [Euphydryas editha]|uniref:Uncharacterized protein n=1 Tax=Euphydryas editha TaxID=104508 RepID=A0AAU9UUH6_EUPED|nr:unnamed protein product [Euphydryas editha]